MVSSVADIGAAPSVALDVRQVGAERSAAQLGLGGIERLLRTAQHVVHRPGMARCRYTTDGGIVDGNRTSRVSTTSSRAPVSRRPAATVRSSGVPVSRITTELIAGKAAEMIVAAQLGAHAPGDRRDDLVSDAEAISLIDAVDLVDRHQEKAAGRARLAGFLESGFQHFGRCCGSGTYSPVSPWYCSRR